MQDLQQSLIEAIKLVGLGLVLWLVASPAGWGLRWLIVRVMPAGVTAAFVGLGRRLPGTNHPHRWLAESLGALRHRIMGGRRVRTAMDQIHRAFGARITSLRGDLARDLSVVAQGGAQGDQTLVGLLRDFDRASAQAHRFEAPDSELPDQSVDLSIAQSRFFWSVLFSVAVGLANCGLLLLFFRDVPMGVDIPGIRLDVSNLAALVLPLLEFGTGFVFALNAEEGERDTARTITKVAIASGLAIFEAYIFNLLFQNIAQNVASGEVQAPGGIDLATAAPFIGIAIGVAMVLFQVQSGDGAGRNRGRIKRMKPIQTIRQQLAAAQDFVDTLPQRYGRIDGAAVTARQSVQDFLAAVQEQNAQDAPVVDRLRRAREDLLASVAAVNPASWAPDGQADAGDTDDALRMSWGTALLALVVLPFFIFVAGGLLASLPMFGASTGLAYFAATGLALGAFLLLPGLMPRTALVVEEGNRVRRWLPAGGGSELWLAVGYATLVSLALFGIGIYARGIEGVLAALIALALLAIAAWFGGSPAQLWLGVSFLVQAGAAFLVYLALLAWLVLRVVVLFLLGLATTLVNWAAMIVGLPITLAQAVAGRRQQTSALGRMVA